MDSNRFDSLVDGYLAAPAAPAEALELERLLQVDPATRRKFVERLLLEVHLHEALAGIAPVRLPEARARKYAVGVVGWLTAAVLLAAIGIGLLSVVNRSTARLNEVISGQVKVDGSSVKEVPEEKWFEV